MLGKLKILVSVLAAPVFKILALALSSNQNPSRIRFSPEVF